MHIHCSHDHVQTFCSRRMELVRQMRCMHSPVETKKIMWHNNNKIKILMKKTQKIIQIQTQTVPARSPCTI